MKKITSILIAMIFGASAFTQTLSGYDIMKKSDEVPKSKTSSYTATMTLTDKKGNTRIREVLEKSLELTDSTKSVIIFTKPKDVSGVGYLTISYKEDSSGNKKDSDNWLYMPAMKKVRRISGSESGGDFMGTDFTYDDMGDRGLNKDNFQLIGEENIDGASCYKVECKAKNSTEKNPRKICWIRKDNFMLCKAEFYDRQNELQRELICSDIKMVDGFWTTGKMLMKNIQKDHSTLIEMNNVSYGEKIDESLFSVAALEKGRVR